MLATLWMVSYTGVKAAVTSCYFVEVKQAAIQLDPASMLLFYPPAEKQRELSSNHLLFWRTVKMAAQPGSIFYEMLFDSLNLIYSI